MDWRADRLPSPLLAMELLATESACITFELQQRETVLCPLPGSTRKGVSQPSHYNLSRCAWLTQRPSL